MRLTKIYQHFTGKTTLNSLQDTDFPGFQSKILNQLKIFLLELKQYCIDSEKYDLNKNRSDN